MQIEVVTGPELTVVADQKAEVTEIGTPEFIKVLLFELNKKKVWRSLSSLSDILHVDPQALSGWLDHDPQIIRRAGKQDGSLYYALLERLSKESHTISDKKEETLNRVVREEDRYALAMLHMVYFQFYKTLKTYGLEISQRDAEAFSNFTASLDKLESGLLLFSKKTKASMEKLPKFN